MLVALVVAVSARTYGCPTPFELAWVDEIIAVKVNLPPPDATDRMMRTYCKNGTSSAAALKVPPEAEWSPDEITLLREMGCENRLLYGYNVGRGVFDPNYGGAYNKDMMTGLQITCNEFLNGTRKPTDPAGIELVKVARELLHNSCSFSALDGLISDIGFRRYQIDSRDYGYGYNYAADGAKAFDGLGPAFDPLKQFWQLGLNEMAIDTVYGVIGRSLAAAEVHGCGGTWYTPNSKDVLNVGITVLEIDFFFDVPGKSGAAAVATLRESLEVYETCHQVLQYLYGREEIPGVMISFCVEQTAGDDSATKPKEGAFATVTVPLIEITVNSDGKVYSAAMQVADDINTGSGLVITAVSGHTIGHAWSASLEQKDEFGAKASLNFDDDDTKPLPGLFTVADLMPSMPAIIARYTAAPTPAPSSDPDPQPVPGPPPPPAPDHAVDIGVGIAVVGIIVGVSLALYGRRQQAPAVLTHVAPGAPRRGNLLENDYDGGH
ncbi:MAG: hypothetical protein ACPGR8_13505 [Limisphaerales bacterium]